MLQTSIDTAGQLIEMVDEATGRHASASETEGAERQFRTELLEIQTRTLVAILRQLER
jgi:hypothetical protein